MRLYFTPSPEPEESGLDGKPAKKVVLPEDVRLLDLCTEAAYKHLDEASYSAHQIQEAVQARAAQCWVFKIAPCLVYVYVMSKSVMLMHSEQE